MHWLTSILIALSTLVAIGYAGPIETSQGCGTIEQIQEILQNQLETPINCDQQQPVDPRQVFKLVKCSKEPSKWVQNLEIVFKKLKENQTLKSMYSMLLVVHSELVLNLDLSEEDKQKLLNIKQELPKITKQVFAGKICSRFGDGDDTSSALKVFMDWNKFTNEDPEGTRFQLDNGGPTSVIIANSKYENIVLVMDRYSQAHEFDFPVKIEHGKLERVHQGEENNRDTLYLCKGFQTGLNEVLLPNSASSKDFCFFNKLTTALLQNAE